MAHITVPEAEKLLDTEIKVLNRGFVRLVDYMGGDGRIVQSARVSYGEGTKTVREDKGLITYLLRNEHMSPFEQVIFTFHIKLPIFVARQMIRHRTARLNEISGRYSVMTNEFYLPEEKEIRFQSTRNRQGRSEEDVPPELKKRVLEILQSENESVYSGYLEMIDADIARELARVNLPLSLYTQWYWQIDLRNLFNFLKLRLDHHAQHEIRVYAEAMYQVAKAVAPLACEAFDEHVVRALRLSGSKAEELKKGLAEKAPELLKILEPEI